MENYYMSNKTFDVLLKTLKCYKCFTEFPVTITGITLRRNKIFIKINLVITRFKIYIFY